MLVCRIEMWPGGDRSKARDLGAVLIANTGRGTETQGEYSVQLTGKPEHFKRHGFWRTGAVTAFPRKRLGAYDLLLRALAAVIGERNIQAHLRRTARRRRRRTIADSAIAGPCISICTTGRTMLRSIRRSNGSSARPRRLPGSHMAGTERFRCTECGCLTYASDGITGFSFAYDKPAASAGVSA